MPIPTGVNVINLKRQKTLSCELPTWRVCREGKTKASALRGRRVRSERGGPRGCTRGPALEEGTTALGTYFLQKARPQGDQVLSYSRGRGAARGRGKHCPRQHSKPSRRPGTVSASPWATQPRRAVGRALLGLRTLWESDKAKINLSPKESRASTAWHLNWRLRAS